MKKQKLALLLVMVMLLQLIPIMPEGISMAFVFKTKTPNYDGTVLFVKDPYYGLWWSEYRTLENLPPATPYYITIQGNKFYFNTETWADKGIVVYGSYENIPSNDFKNATGHLDAKGKYVETPNKGYYANGKGEYRYHGFDGAGNKFSNGDFPIDQESGNKASDKNWIYRVWELSSPYYNGNKLKDTSSFNKTAMGKLSYYSTEDIVTTRKWINDGLPFQLMTTTNATDKNAYNYAHVLTPSTTRFGGEVVMYHYRPDLATKVWYQVFTLDTIKQKVITPVTATVEIISKNDELVPKSAAVTYTVKVTGKLNDDELFDGKDSKGVPDKGVYDEVLKSSRYHRGDIDSWTFTIKDQITNELKTFTMKKCDKANTGSTTFEITIPYEKYKNMVSVQSPILNVIFSGTATCNFDTGEKCSDDDHADTQNSPDPEIGTMGVPVVIVQEPFEMNIDAPNEMLDTEKFHIAESTPLTNGFTRTVTLNGVKLNRMDAEKFITGNWTFPLIGSDKIYSYVVNYNDGDKRDYNFINYIQVYTTKPKAQFKVTGTFKENRLIEAITDVVNVNSSYLMANATVEPIYFKAENQQGSDTLIKYGTQNIDKLSFIVKAVTEVNMSMQTVSAIPQNRIERNDIPSGYFESEVFNYLLYTQDDYKPALISNVWNSLLKRNEKLDFYYDAASVDQDNISVSTYKILYDANSDGTPETIIRQGNYADYTEFKPTELGKYKLVFYAEETFGQPTLSQFITADDKRTFTIEREFLVDNLAPMTKVYTDIEYDFPLADVIVLNDGEISRDLNNTIVANKINWVNGLRQTGIEGDVQIWDCHTYIYSQDASTNLNTGESSPSSTTPYSSGGYSGTLALYNTTNNPYNVDEGYNVPQTTSKWCDGGSAEQTGFGDTPDDMPDSVWYDDGEYSGYVGRTGYRYKSWEVKDSKGNIVDYEFIRTTNYGDTLSRIVDVWQVNWVSHDDYTGYYSGKIYKNVKQEFTPTLRNSADKYIVYFADATVNNKADIEKIKSYGKFKIILVGQDSTKAQYPHDYFIQSGYQSYDVVGNLVTINTPLTTIMSEVNKIIGTNNPSENRQTILVGETFALSKSDYDDEKDPITEIGYEYVHNPNFYDNSVGLETGTLSAFSEANTSFSNTMRTSFSKPGQYSIYRKVKDVPVGKASFTKDSNIPRLDIYVHRRPIADFTLDWDYSPSTSSYKTTWVDLSYDLDHQYSDAQRGIRDRKIMYRKTSGDNVWIYSIPDNLTSGTYELRYMVKDIEGAWSNEKTKNFTLTDAPSIQLAAKLRTLDPKFSVNSIPASEFLELYDVSTRYPYGVYLEVALYNSTGTVKVGATKTINLNASTGLRTSNDTAWKNISYQLADTLLDGNYQIKIKAISTVNTSVSNELSFPVTVFTPINLASSFSKISSSDNNLIYATTSIYPSSAKVELFRGSIYAVTIPMSLASNANGVKTWVASYPGSNALMVPEGYHTARFTATNPSTKFETLDKTFFLEHLKITSTNIWGDWNHWDGGIDKITKVVLQNNPHRFMSHENIHISAVIVGNPDRVEVTMSPELTNYVYTNSKGSVYRHNVDFGYPIRSFPLAMSSVNRTNYAVEYVLPLADWTLDYSNVRKRSAYSITITAYKGIISKSVTTSVELTGNIHDLTYYQPEK